jgi:hypothetical protein
MPTNYNDFKLRYITRCTGKSINSMTAFRVGRIQSFKIVYDDGSEYHVNKPFNLNFTGEDILNKTHIEYSVSKNTKGFDKTENYTVPTSDFASVLIKKEDATICVKFKKCGVIKADVSKRI